MKISKVLTGLIVAGAIIGIGATVMAKKPEDKPVGGPDFIWPDGTKHKTPYTEPSQDKAEGQGNDIVQVNQGVTNSQPLYVAPAYKLPEMPVVNADAAAINNGGIVPVSPVVSNPDVAMAGFRLMN